MARVRLATNLDGADSCCGQPRPPLGHDDGTNGERNEQHTQPPTCDRREAVWVALDAAATILGERHEYSRLRQSMIAANAELQERELIEMASLSAALADGLRHRGVRGPDASLAAEVGIAVLRWRSNAG